MYVYVLTLAYISVCFIRCCSCLALSVDQPIEDVCGFAAAERSFFFEPGEAFRIELDTDDIQVAAFAALSGGGGPGGHRLPAFDRLGGELPALGGGLQAELDALAGDAESFADVCPFDKSVASVETLTDFDDSL